MFDKLDELKNSASILKIAKSGEVQQLMSLLKETGGVEEAAKKASTGDTAALMSMVQTLLQDEQGASLIETIQKQADEAGLK